MPVNNTATILPPDDISMEIGSRIRRTLSRRKCSYCREEGHRINNCNHNDLLLFEDLCNIKKNQIDIFDNKVYRFTSWLVSYIILHTYIISIVKAYAISKCNSRLNLHINRYIEVICNKIYNIEDDITNSDYVQLSNTPIIDGYIPSLLSYISNNIIKHDINATIVKYNGPDKEKNCGICWCDKNDQDFIKFNCSHETCNTCLNKIVGENNSTSCPFCRTKITKIQLNEGTKITFAIKTD